MTLLPSRPLSTKALIRDVVVGDALILKMFIMLDTTDGCESSNNPAPFCQSVLLPTSEVWVFLSKLKGRGLTEWLP